MALTLKRLHYPCQSVNNAWHLTSFLNRFAFTKLFAPSKTDQTYLSRSDALRWCDGHQKLVFEKCRYPKNGKFDKILKTTNGKTL